MKCGNCKGKHSTASEVRHCFAINVGKPSDKQMSLAQALGREKVRLPEYKDLSRLDYELMIDRLGRRGISDFITRMLKQPNAGISRDELFAKLENGKYALRNEDNEDIRFYCIGGTRHRVLRELTGAPGDFKMQRIYRPEKILKRIADDPVAAFALFGLSVGTCGRCGSPLTQKHTRERGIGDTCYAKMTA